MEDLDVILEDDAPIEIAKKPLETIEYIPVKKSAPQSELINCLQNKKVKITFLPREGGLVTDPNHVLYGGLGINSKIKIVVPQLESGAYKNVLTNSEKAFLEHYMGLEENALSVYKKVDNYWSNRGPAIGKEGIILDLTDPNQYITYKIVLANPQIVCPSWEHLKSHGKKATYRFIIEDEDETTKEAATTLDISAEAYTIYGENKSNHELLALIYELATKRSINYKDETKLFSNIAELIKINPKGFVEAANDEFLKTKFLIKKSIELGTIRKRGQYYYLAETNKPLCNDSQEPTLMSACRYINLPKNQEIKFALEAGLNN